MVEHELLTIEEVANYLRVSERTVYDWAHKGEIPCGKLGTTWRFKRIEVERWVDERLSKPPSTGTAPSINIGDVLAPERILFFEGLGKEEALRRLIDCLAETPEVKDKRRFADEIFRREELMSTGIGFSVAVPHVRLDCVKNLIMAVGIASDAVADYESLDEEPVRIVCMVAARADQHAQYLKTLGAVSSLLKMAAVREALLSAKDVQGAFAILSA